MWFCPDDNEVIRHISNKWYEWSPKLEETWFPRRVNFLFHKWQSKRVLCGNKHALEKVWQYMMSVWWGKTLKGLEKTKSEAIAKAGKEDEKTLAKVKSLSEKTKAIEEKVMILAKRSILIFATSLRARRA